MSTRNDFKQIAEAYGGVGSVPISPLSMLGGKQVMVTMDMPGAEAEQNLHHDHESGHDAHEGNVDHSEIEMACAELHKVVEYAPKLAEMVRQMEGLEGWVSSKITKAADYISSVYHWLEYKQHEGGEEHRCDGCSNDGNMFTSGHEDTGGCQYAKQGCTCGGCPECH